MNGVKKLQMKNMINYQNSFLADNNFYVPLNTYFVITTFYLLKFKADNLKLSVFCYIIAT